jgi:hypothetical protein
MQDVKKIYFYAILSCSKAFVINRWRVALQKINEQR